MAVPRRIQPILHAFSPGPVIRAPGRPIGRICLIQYPDQKLLQLQHHLQKRFKYTSPGPKGREEPLSRASANPIPDSQLNNSIPENPIFYNRTQPQERGGSDARLDPAYAEQISQEAKAMTQYLRPGIFALLFSAGVYVGLSYWEAKEQIKKETKAKSAPQLSLYGRPQPPRVLTPPEAAKRMWEGFNPIGKVTFGIMGTNGLVHLLTAAVPKYKELLAHTPAFNRRWTLVTSTFVHFGFWHLALNMWACYNFLVPAGLSPLFNGDPHHLLSFFLSTGALSGYGQHLATLPTKAASMATLTRSGGASGALFGALAIFCMQYPNAQVGIILIPFSFAAINMLPAVMAFDLVGMVRGYKFTNMGHAAHLSGACIGIAYSYLDGRVYLWDPLVKFWKKRLGPKAV